MSLGVGGDRRILGGVVGGDGVRRLNPQPVGFRVSPLFWSGSRALGGRIWASGSEFAETGISTSSTGTERAALFSNFAGEESFLLLPLHSFQFVFGALLGYNPHGQLFHSS